jgi:hypothetical protein
MGHARPSITLDVYAHEIEETQHGDGVSAALSGAFGGILDRVPIVGVMSHDLAHFVPTECPEFAGRLPG